MIIYNCGYSDYYVCLVYDGKSVIIAIDNGHEWTVPNYVDSFFFLGLGQVGHCDYAFIYPHVGGTK